MARSRQEPRKKNYGFEIILVAAVLLQIVSGIQYFYTKRGIENEARSLAKVHLENTNLVVAGAMNSVEVAIGNLSGFVSKYSSSRESIMEMTKAALESSSTISECGVLFVPDFHGAGSIFHPASYKLEDGTIKTVDHSENGFDYYQRDWYRSVISSGEKVWTDPYISNTDKKLICTYSQPVRDKEGKIIAVIYGDISMNWLQALVEEGASSYPGAFSVILGKSGTPVIDTRGGNVPTAIEGIGAQMVAQKSGEQKITYSDTVGYAYYSPVGQCGWSMAIVCPKKEMFKEFYKISNILVTLMLLGILLLGFILYRAAKNFLSLEKLDNEKQRMENELNIAHGIQMGMVPKIIPSYRKREDIDIFASLAAAREVGGDLYDFFIGKEYVWFCIGDVSGKGVPASLVMAVTRSLFRTVVKHESTPEGVMETMNNSMSEMNENNMFVTMFIGRLDLFSGRLDYCNAGHTAPVILSPEGNTFVSMKPNIALGLMEGYQYSGDSTVLRRGETIFLYTDGITEATNTSDELFGEKRMMEALDYKLNPEALLSSVSKAVDTFTEGAQQSDDLTMLAIRFKESSDKTLSLEQDLSEIEKIPSFIESLGLDEKTTDELNLAIEEAVTNIISYSSGKGDIEINAKKKTDRVIVTLKDNGKPFDPTSTIEPDISSTPNDRPIGGLGIFLVRRLMDEVSYDRKDGVNILTLIKKLPAK